MEYKIICFSNLRFTSNLDFEFYVMEAFAL